jgi:hypothetical protein
MTRKEKDDNTASSLVSNIKKSKQIKINESDIEILNKYDGHTYAEKFNNVLKIISGYPVDGVTQSVTPPVDPVDGVTQSVTPPVDPVDGVTQSVTPPVDPVDGVTQQTNVGLLSNLKFKIIRSPERKDFIMKKRKELDDIMCELKDDKHIYTDNESMWACPECKEALPWNQIAFEHFPLKFNNGQCIPIDLWCHAECLSDGQTSCRGI